MSILSGFALYFIFWWLSLFTVLPFGLRTQGEEGTIVDGTMASAPANFRMRKIVFRTTIVATVVFCTYAFLTQYLGLSVDDLPRIAPDHRAQ